MDKEGCTGIKENLANRIYYRDALLKIHTTVSQYPMISVLTNLNLLFPVDYLLTAPLISLPLVAPLKMEHGD